MATQEGPARSSPSKTYLLFAAGFLFSILWPSAGTAIKIGLLHAQPFVLCIARFFTAGIVMLAITHGIMRRRLPTGSEWKQLAVYGLLNITIYLSLYALAMERVSAGLGSLAVAANPVFISLITSFLFGHKFRAVMIVCILLCVSGVLLAAWPMLQDGTASPSGIAILMISMLVYSAGVIYFSKVKWNDLDILTINGWQTLFGGIFLFPAAGITYRSELNDYNMSFAWSIFWLAIPVSVVAVQLWLYLLRDNAVKASFWLFLCPVAGFVIANVVLNEAIGAFTIAGMLMVIAGLYLVYKRR